MKKKYYLIVLFIVVLVIKSWSQDCPCSNLNKQSGISYINDWQHDEDGTSHVTGLIPFNGNCFEYSSNHYKITRTYKDGKMLSTDSFKVAFISWNDYHSGDSIYLQDLKKSRKFNLVNTDPAARWKLWKFDIYFTKELPDIITDSSRISRMTSNYFHGKKCKLNLGAWLYLKNASAGDFDYVKICPRKVTHNHENEIIDEYILYLKKE